MVWLSIDITIAHDDAGKLTGTVDSPEQGGFDIPLGEITNEDGASTISVPSIVGRYEAGWNTPSSKGSAGGNRAAEHSR